MRFSRISQICAIVVCCIIATSIYAIDADPILHFSFDELRLSFGEVPVNLLDANVVWEVTDISTNDFDGNLTGGKWIDGVSGSAFEFNESAVTVDAIGINPDAFTIELWMKPAEQIDGGGRIDLVYRLNGGGRPHITFNRGGVLFGFYFGIRDGEEKEVVSNQDAWEAEWTHVAFVQDAEKAQIYVNGELDAEADTGGPARFDFAEHGLSIAANQGGSNFFNGAIDEFRIWDIALSAEKVNEAMNLTPTAVDPAGKLTATWAAIKSAR